MTDVRAVNEALRELVAASARLQELGLGTSVQISVHGCDLGLFSAVDVIAGWPIDGAERYGHVEGADHGFLVRTVCRDQGTLVSLFRDFPIRRELA